MFIYIFKASLAVYIHGNGLNMQRNMDKIVKDMFMSSAKHVLEPLATVDPDTR